MYHRDFIKKFAPDLKSMTENAILEKTKIKSKNINGKINSIVMHLANLLKRVYSIEKVHDEITSFKMKLVIILIKSKDNYLKHDGMILLAKLLHQIKTSSSI